MPIRESAFRQIAWAKLNLTLEVLGRRADGFHELRSLVAFAGVGDSVEFAPQDGIGLADGFPTLDIDGPFGSGLQGPNLILNAARAVNARIPGLVQGHFRLVKTLPVAAGLGGGSADAAAALRLIAQACDGSFDWGDAEALAPGLGSDVAVCLRSVAALMTGRGEIVEPVSGFPKCGVVLANPGVVLATSAVYRALSASPLAAAPEPPPPPDFAGDFEALIAYASARGNDLEPPAKSLAPEVTQVLSVLSSLEGVRLVRLSGSGATCFALFATPREALRASIVLAGLQPDWWIAASTLEAPKTG